MSQVDRIRIERARPRRDDAFALAAMTLRWDLAGGAPNRPGFLDEFADAWLDAAASRPAWIARRPDGNPVGFAIGALVTSLPSLRRPAGGWLHLSGFYVDPDLRGQGLGQRLMDQVVAFARERGLSRVQLNATDEARAFYRRAGFGGPQDTLMQLVLSGRLPAT
ncbi:GNAT family N-acetyltransferase [Flexivirga sp. ID2601S]|uniref:GNAT family N-acetyltransferase n=1 Tax=Flexivirga aerilata TaxID=1656889 RepID=A0A849AMR7_9MICO|nr:GNAT family N-acetyltransferase [Flexivirga aerilata]